MAQLAVWVADGQDRGLLPARSSRRVRQKLNGRVSYFLREAGRGICQDGLLKGQRERAGR